MTPRDPSSIPPGDPETTATARQLLSRVVGGRAAEFDVEVVPRTDAPQPRTDFVRGSGDGEDWFEVDSDGGGAVLLRGSSGVSVASALRWYLRTACRTQVTSDAPLPELPDTLPSAGSGRITSPYRHRYHFNICTFGYTTAFWDWERWERHIDWMALHGVNTPLAMTGMEAVWQRALIRLGLTSDEAREFLGGPSYLPWNWLASAAGWGGPLPQDWIDEHAELGRRIVDRERALGMRPILQGFAGHVPAALGERVVNPANLSSLDWWDFQVHVLDPRDPLFAEFGGALLEEQTRLLGTDHLYAADPFIETTPPADEPEELARVARAVHSTMTDVDPRATWVLQAWPFSYRSDYWTPDRTAAFLDAVPDQGMLILDLWAEHQPVWPRTEGYRGKPWVWCMLHSLGGRPGLYGKLDEIAGGPARARADSRGGSLDGVGASMEAFGDDPVLYELLADVSWHGEVADVREWLATWVECRYGRTSPGLLRAWELLREDVYGATGPGPSGSVVICRPTLEGDLRPQQPPTLTTPPSPDVSPNLVEAWALLLTETTERDSMGGPLDRDLSDVTAQVLSHLACRSQHRAADAALARDPQAFEAAASELLRLIEELDALVSTQPEYQFQDRLADARAWGRTPAEADLYESNVRRLLTVWGHPHSQLHDYGGRHWAGLLGSFHLLRWRAWYRHVAEALEREVPYDAPGFETSTVEWEERWVRGEGPPRTDGPPRTASHEATTREVAHALMARYGENPA